ncbi:hypothetical protein E2C01_061617 [Portunus trituberculatus]|uniref:Uncharacterized protein n=1 Tax=Portunus trituberculatus TaxID=210409 RepID=A0A5B7H8M7_PORTR|nr:hypothetical protein [Portunus trituberculatus]
MIAQKNSSILPAINARVQAVLESGLYNHWVQQGFANGTACDSAPSTVTVHQSFSLASLWVRSVRGARGRTGVWAPRLPSRDDSLPQRPFLRRLLLQEMLKNDHETKFQMNGYNNVYEPPIYTG